MIQQIEVQAFLAASQGLQALVEAASQGPVSGIPLLPGQYEPAAAKCPACIDGPAMSVLDGSIGGTAAEAEEGVDLLMSYVEPRDTYTLLLPAFYRRVIQ